MGKFGSLRALVTPHMTDALSSVLDDGDLPDALKGNMDPTTEQYIEVAHLRQLCSTANNSRPGAVSMHHVMQGSELSMPPLPQRERNPELVARLERIKAYLAQKEYDKMTGNLVKKDDRDGSIGQQYRQVTKQTGVIFNSVLTVIGSFVFVFFAVRYIGMDLIAQVSSGLFVAFLVFFADLYFILRDEINQDHGVPLSTKRSLAGPRSQKPLPSLPSKT